MSGELTDLVRHLRSIYPDLPLSHVEQVTEGQNNTVLIVNGSLIFRFPRYDAGIQQLEREVTLLRALKQHTPVPIPDPIYTNWIPRVVGRVFAGYPLLPGIPLSQIPATADIQPLASQLGAFLAVLHAIPLDTIGVVTNQGSTPQHWEDLYHRMIDRLFPLMRTDARDSVRRHFETFLTAAIARPIQRVLVHGDLGAGNILYNSTTGRVTGIIDFGSAHVDDPAVDLAAASTIQPTLLNAITRCYPTTDDLLDRVMFYRGTFALQEALSGIETGNTTASQVGLAPYV